ncbi:MAG: hypothetical protein HQL98_11720 [Magnetococcales bacterium]|nr:hypothetical protein [Magnetococcales bacterium]
MGEAHREDAAGAWLETAMNQALEADRQAAETMAASRKQAEEILLQAHRVVAEIETRTDRRLTSLQKGQAKSLKKRLESIKRHQQRAAPFEGDARGTVVDPVGAAQRLAARLTGAK